MHVWHVAEKGSSYSIEESGCLNCQVCGELTIYAVCHGGCLKLPICYRTLCTFRPETHIDITVAT